MKPRPRALAAERETEPAMADIVGITSVRTACVRVACSVCPPAAAFDSFLLQPVEAPFRCSTDHVLTVHVWRPIPCHRLSHVEPIRKGCLKKALTRKRRVKKIAPLLSKPK